MPADLGAELQNIAASGSSADKIERYKQLATVLLGAASGEVSGGSGEGGGLGPLFEHLVTEAVALVVSRAALTHVAESLPALLPDVVIAVAEHAVARIAGRVVSFEEVDAKLRDALAEAFCEQDDFAAAAHVLAGINLENGRYNDTQKAGRYVRLAELYLEDDDSVNADVFINRAGQVVHNCSNEDTKIRFRARAARVAAAAAARCG